MITPTKDEIIRYMRSVVLDHMDWRTLEVNTTELAEDAANHFDHDEWLDVSEHEVWDYAVDVAAEVED